MTDIVRITDDDDPDRCQSVISRSGQCRNKKYGVSNFCLAHGGNKANDKKKAEGLRNYRLTKHNVRLQEMCDSPDIKSLRDEIAILRIILEERLNQCKDSSDMIYQSGPISDMIMKIEKVVTSCHKLENSMGSLLDKQAIIQFGTELISIISDVVSDEQQLTDISQKIITTVARTLGEEE